MKVTRFFLILSTICHKVLTCVISFNHENIFLTFWNTIVSVETIFHTDEETVIEQVEIKCERKREIIQFYIFHYIALHSFA